MAIGNAFKALNSIDGAEHNTNTSLTQLPANILEAFIPGYSVISKFLLDVLGFDITLVVSVCLLIFGLFTSIKFLGTHAYDQFEEHFMSYVCINSDDDLYEHILEWLQGQRISKNSRRLIARTSHGNAWDLQEGGEEEELLDPNTLVNFSNWDSKIPPKFHPSFGRHRFVHRGRIFEFRRDAKQMMLSGWGGSSVFQEDETIRLTCIGRSTQPIKDLMRECRDSFLDKEKACTVVRRPAPKDMRGRGRSVWNKVATRPSRPMETVVLDHDQKDRILADINEYLHPSTPRWYANRGIPYRRGYLFHGPPGTGKSSLAWAIAGVFGLDIYCISLVEPSLTEEDLGLMFSSLPRRCVVLLEDIDSAGLIRRQEPEQDEKTQGDDATAKIGNEIAKALKSVQSKGDNSKDNNKGISLSGLLNAIDGVASHEGRVLVMTTNFPDKLDDALIRPGRIDMKVKFSMSTRHQIYELFTRMYSPDTPAKSALRSPRIDTPESSLPSGLHQRSIAKQFSANHQTISKPLNQPDLITPPQSPGHITPAGIPATTNLEQIASQFAAKLPEDTFTPAEIQGYLLTRKKDPQRALDEVETWKVKQLEAKDAKSKAAPV
ncbi:hypothetical protein MMC07_005795 [Pseudocyphellaria aurata]|nr:hypothetical protein [Pseudocyphellaria aurata]